MENARNYAGPLGLFLRIFDLIKFKYESMKILRTIDMDQFRVFQSKYRTASPDPGYSKYLNIRPWIQKNVAEYYRLGLNRSKPLRILDIGTGCGYFPYVCNYYGHNSIAIDLDDVPMYNEITAFLGINRKIWKVRAYENLPDFGVKFDLLTAFLVCFNKHNSPNLWQESEWTFFLEDIALNQLNRNGRVFLLLNEESINRHDDKKIRSFFGEKGACVSGNRIQFATISHLLK